MSDFDEYKGSDVFLLVDARFYHSIDPKESAKADFFEVYAKLVGEKGNFVDLERIVLASGDNFKKQFNKGKINKKYIISVFANEKKKGE
ncbi:hypothetical protein HY837_02435 [archaeon]|nr:hypothetical protein [archaeon]